MPGMIRDWAVEDQPIERLYYHGPGILSVSELMSILIQPVHRQKEQNALDLTRDIMSRFGIRDLAGKGMSELLQIPGVTRTKAAILMSAMELGKRAQTTDLEKVSFGASTEVAAHYLPRLRDLKQEVFIVLMLDARNKLIREVKVSEGSLTASIVHPREVFKPAILESAASVIFLHNHPSGDPSASQDDIKITTQLVEAGKILDIRVLDHIIVGDRTFTSLAARGFV